MVGKRSSITFLHFWDFFGHFLVTFSDTSVTSFVTFFANSFCQTPFAAGRHRKFQIAMFFLTAKQQRQVEGAQTFRNKKSLRFFGGVISNHRVFAFSKSQRFRDSKPPQNTLYLNRSLQFGVGRKGAPRIVPICSYFPVSSDLFRFALLVFRSTPPKGPGRIEITTTY